MEVGEKTRSALSKLSSDQQKIPLQGMKQFYADTTKYLVDHLMPTVSEEEVSLVTDEWKVYQAGDTDSTTRRVDHYWADIFKEKSLQGEFKYSILQKLIKSLLSLAHGNADVERSLSANRKTVTPDRASLGDLTINGLRTVKDRVRVCGAPHKVEITTAP